MEQQSPVKPDNIKPQEKMEIKSKYYECYLSWHGEYCDNVPHINFCQFHEMELQKHNSQNGVKEAEKTTSQLKPISRNISEEEEQKESCWKKTFTINKTLLPLKMTLFFFSASAFSILPYLTIHMKDIGITVEHISLMYAVLPFTIFLAPPLVGFLADKMGSYTRSLMLTLIGSGIFHTVLLFLPSVSEISIRPNISSFTYEGNTTYFEWSQCSNSEETCAQWNQFQDFGTLELKECDMECEIDSFTICESVTGMFYCHQNGTSSVSFNEINITKTNALNNQMGNCNNSTMANLIMKYGGKPMEITPGCKLTCSQVLTDIVTCGTKTIGNRTLLNVLYFLFRMLATMCLGCNFVLLHAQTIQMCKLEEENGNTGALGRQYVFEAIAQAMISPSIGKLMDYLAHNHFDGKPNYLIPFIGHDVFLILCIINVFCIKLEVDLPKSSGMKGLKKIFGNLDICFFLAVMFVLGNCYGFVETFLFLLLKDEMHAPMYLLGLTITTGAVISIPFLYVSDWIVKKMGNENVFIVAFFAYAIRYVGYSYITNPWMAFPFEALELFTYQLKKVACSKYIGEKAPTGLLATLNGLAGGMHYGFGKGTGGLIGGAIYASTGSLSIAFRYFGVAAAICGLVYFIYEFFYVGGFATCYRNELLEGKNEDDESKEGLRNGKIGKTEKSGSKNETLEPFLDMPTRRCSVISTHSAKIGKIRHMSNE